MEKKRIHENPNAFYSKTIPLFTIKEKVNKVNSSICEEAVQLSPNEIKERCASISSYGDALEAKPSVPNNYNDSFGDIDNLERQINNINYEIKNDENNDEK